MTARVHVDLFTHPICRGCWDVVKMLQQLAEELPDLLEWQQWSLATPPGRARAQECGVLEVPTIIVAGSLRIVGVPKDAASLRERIALLSGVSGGSGRGDGGN